MKETLYSMILDNKIKTWIFMIIFSFLLYFIGYIIWIFIIISSLFLGLIGYIIVIALGRVWYIVFAIFIIFYNLIAYYYSDKIALKSAGAKPADPIRFKTLRNIVEEVAIAAGVPKPKVYVINDPSPNAFATGRNPRNASIAVTTGMLRLLNRKELQGVIAHEIAHIRNYDILLNDNYCYSGWTYNTTQGISYLFLKLI